MAITATQIAEIITVTATILKEIVDLGPTIIKTAQDAKPFAEVIINNLLGKQITDSDLADIVKQIKALSAQLQEPLPAAQDDDI